MQLTDQYILISAKTQHQFFSLNSRFSDPYQQQSGAVPGFTTPAAPSQYVSRDGTSQHGRHLGFLVQAPYHCPIRFLRPLQLTWTWGSLSQFPQLHYFSNFSDLSKHWLSVKFHVPIWQVLPQLSCGNTCQIWTWFGGKNRYSCKI